jgi:hypothetical protein
MSEVETVYKTIVNANYVYEGTDKEAAIRAWDAESVHRADLHGGIMVQSFQNFIMIRDGWLLHVSEPGHVYLNPRI